MTDRDVIGLLIELRRLERDRPPTFKDGGVSAPAWARRVWEVEEQSARERAARVGAVAGTDNVLKR